VLLDLEQRVFICNKISMKPNEVWKIAKKDIWKMKYKPLLLSSTTWISNFFHEVPQISKGHEVWECNYFTAINHYR
jgi:hypothetical protein